MYINIYIALNEHVFTKTGKEKRGYMFKYKQTMMWENLMPCSSQICLTSGLHIQTFHGWILLFLALANNQADLNLKWWGAVLFGRGISGGASNGKNSCLAICASSPKIFKVLPAMS